MISLLSPQWCYYQNDTQVFSNISNFGHHISLGNVMLCCKDMHPLLLECFPTTSRCMGMTGSDFDSLYDPQMVITVLFLPKRHSGFQQNINFVWPPYQPGKCDGVAKDMHPLLLRCFPTPIRCMRMIGSDSVNLFELHMVITALLIPKRHSSFSKISKFYHHISLGNVTMLRT